jgi:hypothetical protein
MGTAAFCFEPEEHLLTKNEAINQGLTIKNPNPPRHERAYPLLPKRKAAAYTLYMAFFKIKDICTLLNKSERCVNYYISEGCAIYGQRINW